MHNQHNNESDKELLWQFHYKANEGIFPLPLHTSSIKNFYNSSTLAEPPNMMNRRAPLPSIKAFIPSCVPGFVPGSGPGYCACHTNGSQSAASSSGSSQWDCSLNVVSKAATFNVR